MNKKNLKSRKEIKNNLLLIFISLLAFFAVDYFKFSKNKSVQKLRFWSVSLENFSPNVSSIRSHNRVFEQMNFEFVNASNGDDWDILWSLGHPMDREAVHPNYFDIKHKKLLPHQKVNHFPGIVGLVSKMVMSDINSKYNFILPSFYLPDEQKLFDEYVKENPHKKLLEKHFYNRGVKIINVKNLKPKEQHFYQEFMDNPFLIDGHAFDFGVFVLITSFDPIRVYRYRDEVLLRFCSEKYHPFDARNRNKYVVQEESIPAYEMPSFKNIYKSFSFSSKIMFENLILNQGFNVVSFWARIDKAIAQIVKNSERDVRDSLKNSTFSSQHFFELVRFDIILDAELNPFVVEVNMSPNLTPAAKRYEENSLIYEQLIHNVVKMIGGSSYHEFWSRFNSSNTIVTNRKNLATSINDCLKYDCQNSCNKTICAICQPCMTSEVRYQLSEAFREHQNAANFKRVFPLEYHFNDEKLIKKMTKNNQIQMRWYKGKCHDDGEWC